MRVALWLLAASAVAASALPAMGQGLVPFTEEAAARGVNYMMQPYPQTTGIFGFGCGFADLDADGDQDVILLGAATSIVGLFENDGTGHFINRSASSGIGSIAQASGFSAADFDDDGLIDIFITQAGQPYLLLRNLGGFHFADVASAAGVNYPGAGTGSCWGDYDGDGWLDLYVCSYKSAVPGTADKVNKLYRNKHDGTFQDVRTKGVDLAAYSFEAAWFDYDRDGDLDLYLSNDRGHMPPLFQANHLWRNDNGTLVDVSASSGAGVALFSMGLACGDFDNNRYPDIYVTNLTGYPQGYNRLLLNLGDGTFVESSAQAGVGQFITSWGAIFWDFDNDGFEDLYVNNQFLPNSLHHYTGAFPCSQVAGALNITGNTGKSYNSAVADIDGDGDLDLLLNNLAYPVQLFINHHADDGTRRWMEYRVVGLSPNRWAVGARIDTRIGSSWKAREILAGGNGYLGQNDFTVHTGVGTALVADQVDVMWPGGQPTRTLVNYPTNKRWTLYPPARLGDADGDGAVDLQDFLAFKNAYGAAVQPGFEMMDFNGDSQIDMTDFRLFLTKFTGVRNDCDGNGQVDMLDILLDPSLDFDHDGILDSCKIVPGDVNGDGVVNLSDLLAVINQWGPCPTPPSLCPADLTHNGMVDVDDLLQVINNWG